MQQCKDNANEAQFIPLEIKDNINIMAIEQGFYSKVVNLRRKDLKCVTSDNNKNEEKINFQGLSARSQRWFDLEFDRIEVHFSTREPDFYKKNFSKR